jgi:uncharacterized membrane protein YphA (DoxX/SURF4 family)
MLLRRIARPLFASWFLSEGVDALRRPAAHVDVARGAVGRLTSAVPAGALGGALEPYRHPSDRQLSTVVRVHGGATALAALMLATGRAPRTSALTLAALTLPLAAADAPASRSERGHLGEQEKKERRARFLRGLSLTGAALIVAADTAGRPGMRWRVEHARATRATTAKVAAAAASAVAGKKSADAKKVVVVQHAAATRKSVGKKAAAAQKAVAAQTAAAVTTAAAAQRTAAAATKAAAKKAAAAQKVAAARAAAEAKRVAAAQKAARTSASKATKASKAASKKAAPATAAAR